MRYFTNEFIIPAMGSYKLQGCAVINSRILAWKTVRSGYITIENNRRIRFWVNYYSRVSKRNAYFTGNCSGSRCLIKIPDGENGSVTICASQRYINGTTYAYFTYKPSTGEYDPHKGFTGGGKSIPVDWIDTLNKTIAVPEDGTSCFNIKISVPKDTPGGNYYGAYFVKFVSPYEHWYENMSVPIYPLALTIHVPSYIIATGNVLLRMADGEEYSLNNPNQYMLEPIVTIHNYYSNDGDYLINVSAKVYGIGSNKIQPSWITLVTNTTIPNGTWNGTSTTPGKGYVWISRISIPENTARGKYTGIVYISWIRRGIYEERRIPITVEVYTSLYTETKRLIEYINPNETVSAPITLYNRNMIKNLTDVKVVNITYLKTPIINPEEYISVLWDGIDATTHSGITILPNRRVTIPLRISVKHDVPAGFYMLKIIFKDSIGRTDYTIINLHVRERIFFQINRSYFELSEGMNTTLGFLITVDSALPGVKCFDGSPGTYVFLSKHGPAAQFIELPENYITGKCLPIHDTYAGNIKINIPEGTLPGIYIGKIRLRTIGGRTIDIYVTIKVPSTYYLTITPTTVSIPNNGSVNITLTLHNNRRDDLPVSVRFKFQEEYASWMSANNFTLTAPAGGSASMNITIAPPKNTSANSYPILVYEIPVNGTKQQRTALFKVHILPDIRVKVIKCNSTENCTEINNDTQSINLTAYDLLPAYIYIQITNYNVPQETIRITTDAPMNIMSIIYGPKIEHKTMINTINKGETQTYTLYLFYPNNYPPGNYTYHIKVDALYGGPLINLAANIAMKPALEVVPRIYSEAIPGEPTQISYTIRNNAGVDIQLTSSIFGTTSSPLNKSWFSGIDPIIPAKGNYTITFNYTLPLENLGAYYGKILSVSNYGHLRYSDLIIKSQVDVIIGVC